MDIRFQNTAGSEWRAECALVFLAEGVELGKAAPALIAACPWLEISPGLRDVGGKTGERVMLYGHPDLALPRVLVSGLGKIGDGNTIGDMATFREAVATATEYCRSRSYASLALPVDVLDSLAPALNASRETLIKEAVLSAQLSLYRCEGWRLKSWGTAKNAEGTDGATANNVETMPPDPRSFSLLFAEGETPEAACLAAREGDAEAAGIRLAQDCSNAPANLFTPSVLAETAQRIAKVHGFACSVMGLEEIRAAGMGAFWAVARGAREEPRFIVLDSRPDRCESRSEAQDAAPLVLVGKGITFDTGGVSLKPAAKMHEMKGDMGGAAAVLGFFEALGHMPETGGLPRVVGVIPATENMPGGNATRPGDVVSTYSGKTVEILNTDAEGRLILCDALSYAQKNYNPRVLVDIATLTGACVVALGDYGTGLFTEDKELRKSLLDAARLCGDLFWPLPLWKEYDKNLKSDVADMSNMGPREGASINAALFLRRFIEKGVRWAHLDIAGPGYVVKASPLHPVPGGTGVGVRVFCELVRNFEKRFGKP